MYSSQTIFDPPTAQSNMVWVAREYCELIDSVTLELGDTWLNPLSRLLPRLHAAVVALGRPPKSPAHLELPNLEDQFELFSRLRVLLGERDSYWLEFDVEDGRQEMSGSLADDLTDIYFELHHGLDQMDGSNENDAVTIGDWLLGYHLHWGQHLLDAERHIYDLQTRHQIAI